MPEFRYATPADIPLIRQLTYLVWPQTYASMLTPEQIDYMLEMMYSEASLHQQFLDGVHYVIAYEAGEPVGFAAFNPRDLPRFKLEKIYVLPSQQGKGTGKALLEHVASEVIDAGGRQLYLQVKKTNPARYFYEKTGFSIEDEIVLDIGQGFVMDDYIMTRQLVQEEK